MERSRLPSPCKKMIHHSPRKQTCGRGRGYVYAFIISLLLFCILAIFHSKLGAISAADASHVARFFTSPISQREGKSFQISSASLHSVSLKNETFARDVAETNLDNSSVYNGSLPLSQEEDEDDVLAESRNGDEDDVLAESVNDSEHAQVQTQAKKSLLKLIGIKTLSRWDPLEDMEGRSKADYAQRGSNKWRSIGQALDRSESSRWHGVMWDHLQGVIRKIYTGGGSLDYPRDVFLKPIPSFMETVY